MKILVNEMPKEKEECLFYRKETYQGRYINDWCNLTGKPCTLKNENSVLGSECRCLRVGGK